MSVPLGMCETGLAATDGAGAAGGTCGAGGGSAGAMVGGGGKAGTEAAGKPGGGGNGGNGGSNDGITGPGAAGLGAAGKLDTPELEGAGEAGGSELAGGDQRNPIASTTGSAESALRIRVRLVSMEGECESSCVTVTQPAEALHKKVPPEQRPLELYLPGRRTLPSRCP